MEPASFTAQKRFSLRFKAWQRKHGANQQNRKWLTAQTHVDLRFIRNSRNIVHISDADGIKDYVDCSRDPGFSPWWRCLWLVIFVNKHSQLCVVSGKPEILVGYGIDPHKKWIKKKKYTICVHNMGFFRLIPTITCFQDKITADITFL